MSMVCNIESRLRETYKPQHLEVINESSGHNVPPGSETHLKIILVDQAFDGIPRVNRHRKVHDLLKDELATSIHALALHLYTPDEWAGHHAESLDSPPCRGGEG